MVRFEVIGQGAFCGLRCDLNENESVKAESDAMVSRSTTVSLNAKMEGGLFSSLGRLFLTGESLFFQSLSTQNATGHVVFAPKQPGTIQVLHLSQGQTWCFREGAFLCAEETVEITSISQKSFGRAFFSGHGCFVLAISGPGQVAVNSVGSVISYSLDNGQSLVVDNDHVIGWTKGMDYSIRMQGSNMFTSAASGEGLGCFFVGPGSVLAQTHSPSGLRGRSDHNNGTTKLSPGLCMAICIIITLIIFALIVFVIIFQFQGQNWRTEL